MHAHTIVSQNEILQRRDSRFSGTINYIDISEYLVDLNLAEVRFMVLMDSNYLHSIFHGL